MADANINHQDARDYWQSIDADVNGMLGGHPLTSKVDLQGSKNFLVRLGIGGKGKEKEKLERVVDCGAGFVLSFFAVDFEFAGGRCDWIWGGER